ncbi:hypothetical protein RND81_02G167600 [Saponaria officinalis]|uniref:CCHC-type domain-containing protein n=1 Tax=Saponaria officinalis TaxID=3572 RepID=A0AAW1MQT0_SAPOF
MDSKFLKCPVFDGKNYGLWKNMMTHYIKGQDWDYWMIIRNGPHKILVASKEGTTKEKKEEDYDEADYKKAEKNSKAVSLLQNGMTITEFDRFSSCTTAKEIWDGLELAYEGTSLVKKQRIDLLIQKYELFSMEPNESLDSMSARFSSIINELKNLGRNYDTEDIARKVLRSLTKKWRAKVTAIEESKDLSKLTYQELIGSLMAYELTLNADDAEQSRGKNVALASEDVSSDLEEETVLFARRFRNRIFRNKQAKPAANNNNNKTSNKKAFEPKSSFANRGCFRCGESGHMIKDCPTWEKIKDKKRREKTKKEFKQVMLASCWGDLESEDEEGSDDDDEVANLCLSSVSLDLLSEGESLDSDCCFLGESDEDEEEEVSYLELKKKVKKLSRNALVEYFEHCLDKCHEQEMELNDLKEQINDIAEENHILKSKAKLKSKVTSNLATSLDKSESEKKELELKVKAHDAITSDLKIEIKNLQDKKQHSDDIVVLNKRFQDSLDKTKDNNVDHPKCLEEISTLKDLLLHARKVHDKWEGSTKVLDFLTSQSDKNMNKGLGHECYSRRDHSKCKPTSPELHDFRRRKYADLLEYLICNYCGHTERNNNFRWFYDMSFDYSTVSKMPPISRKPEHSKPVHKSTRYVRPTSNPKPTPPKQDNPRPRSKTIRKIWVRKDLVYRVTNHKGPNLAWVPKSCL